MQHLKPVFNSTILFLVFLMSPFHVVAQGVPYKSMRRLTIAPVVYPYYPIKAEFVDRTGETAINAESTGMETFLRFSTYKPGGGFNAGIDFGYFKHLHILKTPAGSLLDKSLNLSGGIITPHITYAWKNIEAVRHLMLNAGVSYRRYAEQSIRSNEMFPDGQTFGAVNFDLPYLRKSSTFLQLGLGLLIERPSLRAQKTYPATLQFQAYLPLFNQANLIDDNPLIFPEEDQTFRDLKFNSQHFGVMYSQVIDVPSNNKTSIANQKSALLQKYNKKVGFAPPLVNFDWPDKSIEGVFSVSAVLQSGQDSLRIGPADSTFMDLSPSLGLKVAYSLHFLGNDKKDLHNIAGRWFMYDLFLTGGLHQQTYRLTNNTGYFSSQQLLVFAEGGLRLGALIDASKGRKFKLAIMLYGGVGTRSPLRSNAVYRNGDENLYALVNQYAFGGIQINDLITIKLNATPIRPAHRQGKFLAQANLEVGVGF